VLDAWQGAERPEQWLELGARRVLGQAVDLDVGLGRRRGREDEGVEADVSDLVDNLIGRPALSRVVQNDRPLGEEGDDGEGEGKIERVELRVEGM
jgi:hypothetical protein